jgi:hypothetical protein
MQKATQKFESDCGRAQVYVENEMPIGAFHDFLMGIKGTMVERMIAAQKQQEEESRNAMDQGSELEEAVPGCALETSEV